MAWIENHWQQLRFNRLDFERKYVVDQVLSAKPRSCVLLARRRGGRQQSIFKLSDRNAANPLESRCLRSLRHSGIAGYLGHGFTRDRRQWMETEYVDGVPLSAWLDQRQTAKASMETSMTVRAASEIFLRLVSTIQYLHCCGWIHGDLSPQNVLIVRGDRRVVLIDFEHVRRSGITNATKTRRRHSLRFASPHEIAGGATTEACEQFALGKLGMILLGQKQSELRESADCLALKAVLDRASSISPGDRFPDLRGVVKAVEASMTAANLRAVPTPTPTSAKPKTNRAR